MILPFVLQQSGTTTIRIKISKVLLNRSRTGKLLSDFFVVDGKGIECE
jgi:hypothetical protein